MSPILIVEDHDDARIMLATMLAIQNYMVVTAANGAEGLVLARKHLPCLVLLDLMMPVLDGAGFRTEQLADPTIRDIPVIVVSAGQSARQQAQALGVHCFIPKPVSFDELTERVATLCGRPG